MKFTAAIAAAIIAATSVEGRAHGQNDNQAMAIGSYGNSTAWVTQTVTAYVTFCPSATSWRPKHAQKTYTGTQSQWVTVTDCPHMCTISNQAGARPTIMPAGMLPKYNNVTVPATPVCSCPSYPAGNSTSGNGANTCNCPNVSSDSSSGSSGSGNGTSNTGASSGSSGSSGSGNSTSSTGASSGSSGSTGASSGSSSGGFSGNGSNSGAPATFEGAATKVGISTAALVGLAGYVVYAF